MTLVSWNNAFPTMVTAVFAFLSPFTGGKAEICDRDLVCQVVPKVLILTSSSLYYHSKPKMMSCAIEVEKLHQGIAEMWSELRVLRQDLEEREQDRLKFLCGAVALLFVQDTGICAQSPLHLFFTPHS